MGRRAAKGWKGLERFSASVKCITYYVRAENGGVISTHRHGGKVSMLTPAYLCKVPCSVGVVAQMQAYRIPPWNKRPYVPGTTQPRKNCTGSGHITRSKEKKNILRLWQHHWTKITRRKTFQVARTIHGLCRVLFSPLFKIIPTITEYLQKWQEKKKEKWKGQTSGKKY